MNTEKIYFQRPESTNSLQSGRICLLFKPSNQWRHLYEFVSSHQEYAFWRESPAHPLSPYLVSPRPDQSTARYPQKTQSWKMYSTDFAEHLLCPSYYWIFSSQEETGASSKHIPSFPPTHMHCGWTSGSWHQRQTGSNCTAPLANVDMDNISSRWWVGWSQILHGRMYFLFVSQLSSS